MFERKKNKCLLLYETKVYHLIRDTVRGSGYYSNYYYHRRRRVSWQTFNFVTRTKNSVGDGGGAEFKFTYDRRHTSR